jgi:hypothetical protein
VTRAFRCTGLGAREDGREEAIGRRLRDVFGMEKIMAGRAHCALCGETIRPDEDALVTPDFIADEADPLWRFADAAIHRACFLVWDRRKVFIAQYNRLARGLLAPDGSHPWMTSEGEVVRRSSGLATDWSSIRPLVAAAALAAGESWAGRKDARTV